MGAELREPGLPHRYFEGGIKQGVFEKVRRTYDRSLFQQFRDTNGNVFWAEQRIEMKFRLALQSARYANVDLVGVKVCPLKVGRQIQFDRWMRQAERIQPGRQPFSHERGVQPNRYPRGIVAPMAQAAARLVDLLEPSGN